MKKNLSKLLRYAFALLMAVSLLSAGVRAAALSEKYFTSGDYAYKLENGEAVLIGIRPEAAKGELILPTEVDGYTVVGVAYEEETLKEEDDYKRFPFSDITSLTVPGTIKTIGEEAFWACYDLKEVVLEPGVTTIENWAFDRCWGLKSVIIPDSVTKVGYGAFGWKQTADWYDTIKGITIYGEEGSAAEAYVKENRHITFRPISEYGKKLKNSITASSMKKTCSTKKQTFSIGAKCKGGAKLTYSSDHKSVAVDSSGKVTIKARFIGRATITIKAAATEDYDSASKKITVTCNPTKTALSRVTSPKKRRLTVKWKKNAVATGYQVQYSTNKDFKKGAVTKNVSKKSINSASYSRLSGGKTYYVRIRTCKKVGGTRFYSAWSGIKKVKVKK